MVFILTGGVESQKIIYSKYLRHFGVPEIYIVAKDNGNHQKICKAIVIERRGMEIYIHPDVIIDFLKIHFLVLKWRALLLTIIIQKQKILKNYTNY